MYYKDKILFRFVFHITRVKININVTYVKKNDTYKKKECYVIRSN